MRVVHRFHPWFGRDLEALAGDFPALWNDPATPMRERKRLLRLLITDVTLTRADDGSTRCQVRFTGGQHHTLTLLFSDATVFLHLHFQ